MVRWFGDIENGGRPFGEENRSIQYERLRGRQQTGWMDSVKRAVNGRGMSVEQGRMIVRDRSEWRALVCIYTLMTQP